MEESEIIMKTFDESMKISIDYNNMMEKFIGDKGFTDDKLASYKEKRTRLTTT